MKKVFIILFLFINISSFAIKHYVATGGGGAGTFTSPFATIAQVNAHSFMPDDTIAFKKGNTWREILIISSSGSVGHNIVFTSYGTGNKPIITGADIFTSWTKEGCNYYTTVTVQPKFVFDNGVPLKSVTKDFLTSCTFYRDTLNSRVYLSFNPSGHILEMTVRDDAIVTAKNYITIDGLQLVNTNFHGINAAGAKHSIYKNCEINYITSRGIYIQGNSLPTYSVIEGNSFNHNQGYAIYMFGGYDTIRNNTIKNIGDYYTTATPFAIYPSGIAIHKVGAGGINTQIYNNIIDTLYGNGSGLYTHGMYLQFPTTELNVYNNIVRNNTSGYGIKMSGSGDIHDNLLYNNSFSGITVIANSVPAVVNIYNNVIYNNGYGIQQLNNNADLKLNIYNNTLYKNGINSPSGNNSEIYINNILTSLIIKNNIFYASDGNLCYFINYGVVNYDSDYNVFYRDDAGTFNKIGNVSETWAAWQTLGHDTHSLNTNPFLFEQVSYIYKDTILDIGAFEKQ